MGRWVDEWMGGWVDGKREKEVGRREKREGRRKMGEEF